MSGIGAPPSVRVMTQISGVRTGTRVRRGLGILLVLVGIVGLFGGFFVPWDVILADPGIVPAPESWVAIWLMGVGLVLVVWPARREGS
jgi:hypothetical protein